MHISLLFITKDHESGQILQKESNFKYISFWNVQMIPKPYFWMGAHHYSERSLLRKVVSPKGHYSEGSFLRRVITPKGRFSENTFMVMFDTNSLFNARNRLRCHRRIFAPCQNLSIAGKFQLRVELSPDWCKKLSSYILASSYIRFILNDFYLCDVQNGNMSLLLYIEMNMDWR